MIVHTLEGNLVGKLSNKKINEQLEKLKLRINKLSDKIYAEIIRIKNTIKIEIHYNHNKTIPEKELVLLIGQIQLLLKTNFILNINFYEIYTITYRNFLHIHLIESRKRKLESIYHIV